VSPNRNWGRTQYGLGEEGCHKAMFECNRLYSLFRVDKSIDGIDGPKRTSGNLEHAVANLAVEMSGFNAGLQQRPDTFLQHSQHSIISQSCSSIELVKLIDGL
jgi:hypothetical protein